MKIASANRGNNGFEGDAGDLCRRYPPRLPARKASSSALPKAPAPQGQVCKATGRRLAAASRGRERGKRGFAAAGRRCFPLFTDARGLETSWKNAPMCAYIVELQAAQGAALPLCAQISSFFLLIVFLRFLLVSRLFASFVHLFLLKPFFSFFLAIIEQAAAEHGV